MHREDPDRGDARVDFHARFEGAAKRETERTVERMLSMPTTDAARARGVVRALSELREMIALVDMRANDATRERASNSCPWTFELLRLLDESADYDLSSVDEHGNRVPGKRLSTVHADIEGDIVSIKDSIVRLERAREAVAALDPAMPEALAEIESRLDTAHARATALPGLAALLQIRPDRNYRKASVLRIVMDVNELSTWRELSTFVNKSSAWSPAPCPSFARDDTYENIRQIIRRSAV